MLALRLPADIEQRLEHLARRTGRAESLLAEEAIREHLSDLEDAYLSAERLGDSPDFIEFDAGMRELGLDLSK